MSQAQEERTHRLVAEWQAEIEKLSVEIDTLKGQIEAKEQIEEKEQKVTQLRIQVDSAMRSDSY